jgi:cold shock protein
MNANTGKVKYYNAEKGFGFIDRFGQKDIFFHIRGVIGTERQVKLGDIVSYELGRNLKGECAVNVIINIRTA